MSSAYSVLLETYSLSREKAMEWIRSAGVIDFEPLLADLKADLSKSNYSPVSLLTLMGLCQCLMQKMGEDYDKTANVPNSAG